MLDLHRLYASSLQRTHLLPDQTILFQIILFQHSPEDQSLHFLMLEDQADPSSSSMMTQPLHPQMHHQHHHQHRHQENKKVRLFIDNDQQAVTYDA